MAFWKTAAAILAVGIAIWYFPGAPRPDRENYDCIVHVLPMQDMIQSRSIAVSKHRDAVSKFDIEKKTTMRILGVLGIFNKGKTWLINRIFNQSMHTGDLAPTRGLSIHYDRETEWLVVDTAGSQATVSFKDSDSSAHEGVLHEQARMEILIQSLVTALSDVIIYVVSDMTWREQMNIFHAFQKYISNDEDSDAEHSDKSHHRLHNQLLVAHNMKSTKSIKEAQDLFDRQIAQKHHGTADLDMNKLVLHANYGASHRGGDRPEKVTYYGFAEEGTEAGEQFNARNAEYLLAGMNTLVSTATERIFKVDLEKELAVLFEKSAYVVEGNGCNATHDRLGLSYISQNRTFCLYPNSRKCEIKLKRERGYNSVGDFTTQDATFLAPVGLDNVWMLEDRVYFQIPVPGVRLSDVQILLENGVYFVAVRRIGDPRFQKRVDRTPKLSERVGAYKARLPFQKEIVKGSIKKDIRDGMLEISGQLRKASPPKTAAGASR